MKSETYEQKAKRQIAWLSRSPVTILDIRKVGILVEMGSVTKGTAGSF